VGGKAVPVGYKHKAVKFILKLQKITGCPKIIAQMQKSGWSYAGKHTFFSHKAAKIRPFGAI
jgi:hypothetical protein